MPDDVFETDSKLGFWLPLPKIHQFQRSSMSWFCYFSFKTGLLMPPTIQKSCTEPTNPGRKRRSRALQLVLRLYSPARVLNSSDLWTCSSAKVPVGYLARLYHTRCYEQDPNVARARTEPREAELKDTIKKQNRARRW